MVAARHPLAGWSDVETGKSQDSLGQKARLFAPIGEIFSRVPLIINAMKFGDLRRSSSIFALLPSNLFFAWGGNRLRPQTPESKDHSVPAVQSVTAALPLPTVMAHFPNALAPLKWKVEVLW